MSQANLLLVDDDDTLRVLLGTELARRGFALTTASSVGEAAERLERQEFDVALVDLRLPDGDGLALLRMIQEKQPGTEVIMLTGHGSIDTAIEAMRAGAFDYLRKPCPVDELEVTLQKALERRHLIERNSILRDGLAPPDMATEFVGTSPRFNQLREIITRVAASDSSVLILGETGVGKDVVAKVIHGRSARARQPFVVVECAALHEELLHSELFGHTKGAYTGAVQQKHGLFEVADKGTIFLDEIGDVSLSTQVKLLRVLETGCFRHVGGTKEIKVDVRVLAATNRDLQGLMAKGFFRSDLFFRISAIRLEVPPLRDRPEDVAVLAAHYLRRLNERFQQSKRLSPEALEGLRAYPWPGNVRELIHALEHAVIMSPSDLVRVEDLPREMQGQGAPPGRRFLPLHEMEREHIRSVLEAVGGNRGAAARTLGISERTLYRKLNEYGFGP